MITATTNNGLVLLGLDRGNCERLLKGEPIAVDLNLLNMSTAPISVVVLGGETLADIEKQIVDVFGPIPEGVREDRTNEGGEDNGC